RRAGHEPEVRSIADVEVVLRLAERAPGFFGVALLRGESQGTMLELPRSVRAIRGQKKARVVGVRGRLDSAVGIHDAAGAFLAEHFVHAIHLPGVGRWILALERWQCDVLRELRM